MSEQPPIPPPPGNPPEGVPPTPPAPTKEPFAWGRFVIGLAILPVAAIAAALLSAAGAAVADATHAQWPNTLVAGAGSLLLVGAVVTGIVLVFLPRWRPVGAGILSCAALVVIIGGAACVALIAGLASMHS